MAAAGIGLSASFRHTKNLSRAGQQPSRHLSVDSEDEITAKDPADELQIAAKDPKGRDEKVAAEGAEDEFTAQDSDKSCCRFVAGGWRWWGCGGVFGSAEVVRA